MLISLIQSIKIQLKSWTVLSLLYHKSKDCTLNSIQQQILYVCYINNVNKRSSNSLIFFLPNNNNICSKINAGSSLDHLFFVSIK